MGVIEGKDVEIVAGELADIMKTALFRRGIAFRIIGTTVEAYPIPKDITAAASVKIMERISNLDSKLSITAVNEYMKK